MGKDEKMEKTVSFLPLSQDEIVMVKKVLVAGGKLGKGLKVSRLDFQNAELKGKQFVMSVPPALVEEIKKNYAEALKELDAQDKKDEETT